MIPRCFSAAAIWSDQGIGPIPLPTLGPNSLQNESQQPALYTAQSIANSNWFLETLIQNSGAGWQTW